MLNLLGDVAANGLLGFMNFVDNFGPAVNDGDEILQVVARTEVALSSPVERFEFRRNKIGCCDQPNDQTRQVNRAGSHNGRRVSPLRHRQMTLP